MNPSLASPRTKIGLEQNSSLAFNFRYFILMILHIPLGYFAESWSALPTIHALLTFMLGGIFLVRDPKPNRLIGLAGYIVGAEVFWRMADASIFHESAKYALVALFSVGILKWRVQLRLGPIIYLSLLLVSVPLTFNVHTLGEAREQLSAVLSGPLTLVVSTLFFRHISLSYADLQRIFRAIMLPIVSISIFILANLARLQFIMFTTASNFGASGGFGPNQVSAILGLGCLLCWLLILVAKVGVIERPLFLGLSVVWLAQTLLTFSRGGLLNMLIAAVFALPFLSANKGRFGQVIIFGLLFAAVIGWLVFPWLNNFTGGMLETRFQDWNVTNRDQLVRAELEIWNDNLIFGVGPGALNIHRAPLIRGTLSAAHTEYSRMLAEHGLFGLTALVIMIGLAIHRVLSTRDKIARGMILAFFAWSFIEMAHSAMRISATPFLYGLAFSMFRDITTGNDASALVLGKS